MQECEEIIVKLDASGGLSVPLTLIYPTSTFREGSEIIRSAGGLVGNKPLDGLLSGFSENLLKIMFFPSSIVLLWKHNETERDASLLSETI